ncbi:MAG: WD40 repeat domain-containing protein [Bauldia sp.]|nr:WD40 repeat domain-containing protein [Bauldia sp.]
MTTAEDHAFHAFVVEATFLGDTTAFALGDGSLRLVAGPAATRVAVHAGAILSAAATLDGRRIITGGDDGIVAATDVDGNVERLAERPRKWIDHVAAGPGDVVGFTIGRQVSVRLTDGGERSLDLPRAAGGIAFAPKGLRLAIARYDGVTLWWPATEAEPTSLDWKGAHLTAAFSPDGKYVVTSMQDNALHGWRLTDGKDMRMSGYPAKPRSISWSAKGRFLATSGANAAILWPFHFKDGPMGKAPLQLGAREALVTRVACHPKQELVAIGYQDGMVLAVRFADAEEALIRRPGGAPVSALAWDGAGKRLAIGTESGAAAVITTD